MTRRRDNGDQSTQESKITVMLIAVVILFLVCQLPTAVALLYKAFHEVEHGSNEDFLLRGLGNIFNFLVAVNAAGNFCAVLSSESKIQKDLSSHILPLPQGQTYQIALSLPEYSLLKHG
ncbi:FMRFamide receptor [Caerostris extrusa]|uniref:FMRFamide receptor n=1 Tax=Caerostris extrusa TaxID=172846 RepID=A0AAV4UKW9_CAEEX|nr:FMRFamide receptor [Caerostris extrusa]